MASRALMARSSRAFSSPSGSARTSQRPPPITSSSATASPKVRRSISSMPISKRAGSSGSGASGWRRAKASRCRVRRAPRCTPPRAAPSRASSQAPPSSRMPPDLPTRFDASSRLADTTCSRLLKSCATPPVIWPSTSIFCACRATASAWTRRVMSATATIWPPSGMALRHTSSVRPSCTASSTAGWRPGRDWSSRRGSRRYAATSPAMGAPDCVTSAGKSSRGAKRLLHRIRRSDAS